VVAAVVRWWEVDCPLLWSYEADSMLAAEVHLSLEQLSSSEAVVVERWWWVEVVEALLSEEAVEVVLSGEVVEILLSWAEEEVDSLL